MKKGTIDKKIDKKRKLKADKSKKKEVKKNLRAFRKFYEFFLSPGTMKIYLDILSEILEDYILIKSKSKYNQVKAVLKKAKDINIEISFVLPDWNKKEDSQKQIIDKYIDSDLLNEILKASPLTKQGKEIRLAIRISYYSGLRLEETLTLTQEKIKENRLNIIGKGSKQRFCYLPKSEMNLLDGFSKFKIDKNYVKTNMSRISKKLKKTFSFHSLRHSFAINLIKQGGSVALLQKLLGHSNLSTTSIYLRYFEDTEQLEKLGF